MNRERLVTASLTAAFALLTVVIWADYLVHSKEIYGDRDAAEADVVAINGQIAQATDIDDVVQLTADRSDAEDRYAAADRKVNDMDGWDSPEWKLKNSIRLAAPAVTVQFGAFTLLAILKPLR
jgi:hypothetical protein